MLHLHFKILLKLIKKYLLQKFLSLYIQFHDQTSHKHLEIPALAKCSFFLLEQFPYPKLS